MQCTCRQFTYSLGGVRFNNSVFFYLIYVFMIWVSFVALVFFFVLFFDLFFFFLCVLGIPQFSKHYAFLFFYVLKWLNIYTFCVLG